MTKSVEDRKIAIKLEGIGGENELVQLKTLERRMPRLDQLVMFENSNAYQ